VQHRLILRVTAGAGLGVCLAACHSHPGPPTSHAPMVGQSVSAIERYLPDATLSVYDVSSPVLHREPAYTGGSAQDQWIVIAACGLRLDTTRRTIAVAVSPRADYTPAVARKAAVGGYDGLYECPL
jgi:hypothetical protein